MPEYMYKAVTRQGQIVRNRVEQSSKNNLIKMLKGNDLLPIEVIQIGYRSKKPKANRRNVLDIDEVMQASNSASIIQGRAKNKQTAREKFNMALSIGQKITERDLIVFTQNFYLLKKANFNNIHALSTLLSSTENLSFRGVIEDILAGVEARRIYVYHNGILFRYIPIYIHKHD